MPGSPEIQRPGHRRRPGASVVSEAASSDESFSEVSKDIAGPSKPRIVRGHHTEASATPQSEEDPRFTRFKITQPFHTADAVRAAWDQSGQDVRKATALLDDPTWKPPVSSPVVTPKTAQQRFETGRVRELEEATKAQKARVRQLGKQSLIYAKQNPAATPPVSKAPLVSIRAHSPATTSPATITPAAPPSPTSPEVTQPRTKRLKRKVVESDSEPDYVESDEDNSRGKSSEEDTHELEALEYFNSAAPEALQELTGCSMEQASKIIEFRPFSSVSDLNTRLGQGRKKAGPAGISSRMFEDCTSIFEGYGTVDNILAKCETIGSRLKAEIATWTGGATREGKQKEKVSSIPGTPDLGEDGALSLRSQAALALRKPDYYISAQPASLSPDLQLKEYQMLGINWLNLLYKEKYSCILADEMGLGKTVQVISFLAHLKDQGSKGPHLVVVPSSTLENWLREFQRFAPDISVRAYYADKNNRGLLRQELLDTRREVDPNGWEILVTTYNLAQGDDRDRKFFRRMHWEACVFDEGHVLKNFQSQRYQALLKFDSKWRLLLTGTPLQNNLQELVSLMNFILPAQFARNMEALRAVFKAKGDSKVTLLAQQRVSRAKKMMTPFVLRRRKDQVLQDLPKKTERIEWCEMTPMQKSIYNDALQRSRKTIFDMEGDVTDPPPPTNGKAKPAKKKTRANARVKDKLYVENSSNVLMDLRKAAAHPMLFRRRFTDDALCSIAKLLLKEPDFKKRGALFELVKEDMEVMTDSELQAFCATYKSTRKFLQSEDCYVQAGKVKVLLKLLTNYQSQGRRVLIFSQFTQILDILQRVLNKENVKFLVLTGSTPVDIRQTLVDEFTEDESIQVFLLSTKAGGMGINLTAASVVIM
ncbi:hypothetical protein EW026_g2522 [Hermanssonia centrifuga]|uniref:DNA helicase n=1 Tax=Hermanssonia centrifuga TaxID=98765 RepID=A0A4S4KQ25_9APHY|nr:hypothetical protein EW026_g2522 [Hermanssonia centrifuga]